jgi:hypothetical protein
MANRAYIVPVRTDIGDIKLQVLDLSPNTSQRNSAIDPPGQTGYFKYTLDVLGDTVVSDGSYVSGSTNTETLDALDTADTTGGGNDAKVTHVANFGLPAYLRERVNADPGTANTCLSPAEALACAESIISRVVDNLSVTVEVINTILTDEVGADTDFDGESVTDSLSFGSLEDVLRILSGEVYVVRANTIITDENDVFLDYSDRATLVDNATSDTFYDDNTFLERGESGFRDIRPLVVSGNLRISCREGRISHLIGTNTLTFTNPNFAYTASQVRAWKPRATLIDGTNIDSTGEAVVCRVYDQDGELIS